GTRLELAWNQRRTATPTRVLPEGTWLASSSFRALSPVEDLRRNAGSGSTLTRFPVNGCSTASASGSLTETRLNVLMASPAKARLMRWSRGPAPIDRPAILRDTRRKQARRIAQ